MLCDVYAGVIRFFPDRQMWQVELHGVKLWYGLQSESVGKENWEGHTELDDVSILGQEMLWKCTKRNLPFSSAMTPGMVELIQMFWRRDERSWTRHFTQFLHDFTRFYTIFESFRRSTQAMFELVDSAQHAADCAVQHSQRILEAQEKARNWPHISIFECSFCSLMFLGFCVLTLEFGV